MVHIFISFAASVASFRILKPRVILSVDSRYFSRLSSSSVSHLSLLNPNPPNLHRWPFPLLSNQPKPSSSPAHFWISGNTLPCGNKALRLWKRCCIPVGVPWSRIWRANGTRRAVAFRWIGWSNMDCRCCWSDGISIDFCRDFTLNWTSSTSTRCVLDTYFWMKLLSDVDFDYHRHPIMTFLQRDALFQRRRRQRQTWRCTIFPVNNWFLWMQFSWLVALLLFLCNLRLPAESVWHLSCLYYSLRFYVPFPSFAFTFSSHIYSTTDALLLPFYPQSSSLVLFLPHPYSRSMTTLSTWLPSPSLLSYPFVLSLPHISDSIVLFVSILRFLSLLFSRL